jgi:hypothetical protein
MTAGDMVRAEACMNLLEQEVMNSLADPMSKEAEKENDQDR